jgi:glycosyltransferase involved in cell wall biosynthesis
MLRPLEKSPWGRRRAAPAPAPRAAREKPVLVHVIPFGLVEHGVQSLVQDICRFEGGKWEMHVVHLGPCRIKIENAVVHSGVDYGRAPSLVASLDPDAVIYHIPLMNYGRINPALCPIFFFFHIPANLRAPKPDWCKPAGVFSNYMPSPGNLGPGWKPEEITVVPLGVDLHACTPASKRERLVAGYVGRLVEGKIPMAWVDALLAWGNPGRKWQFEFYGDETGAHADEVKAKLAGLNWVSFHGIVARNLLPVIYRSFDVQAIPSKSEAGSLVAVEAMASGVPVLARRIDGLPTTIERGGLFFDTDAEFFALLAEMENADYRAVVGEVAREMAETRPLAVQAQKYSDAIFAALSRGDGYAGY